MDLKMNMDISKIKLKPEYKEGKSFMELYQERGEKINKMLREEYKNYSWYMITYKPFQKEIIEKNEYMYHDYDINLEVSDSEEEDFVSNYDLEHNYNSDSSENSIDYDLV